MHLKTVAVPLVLSLLASTHRARADESTPATFKDRGAGDQRNVVFDDDPLTADPLSAQAPQIRVRGIGPRRTLLHLRTNFVAELLTSIENL